MQSFSMPGMCLTHKCRYVSYCIAKERVDLSTFNFISYTTLSLPVNKHESNETKVRNKTSEFNPPTHVIASGAPCRGDERWSIFDYLRLYYYSFDSLSVTIYLDCPILQLFDISKYLTREKASMAKLRVEVGIIQVSLNNNQLVDLHYSNQLDQKIDRDSTPAAYMVNYTYNNMHAVISAWFSVRYVRRIHEVPTRFKKLDNYDIPTVT